MIRGLLPTLGAVASCAPHHIGNDLGDSAADILYTEKLPWAPSEIDVNHDDDWSHPIAGCVDLARSVLLEPLAVNAQPPPGW